MKSLGFHVLRNLLVSGTRKVFTFLSTRNAVAFLSIYGPRKWWIQRNKNPNRSKLWGIFNVRNPHFIEAHKQVHPSTASNGGFLTNQRFLAQKEILFDFWDKETFRFLVQEMPWHFLGLKTLRN